MCDAMFRGVREYRRTSGLDVSRLLGATQNIFILRTFVIHMSKGM